MKCPACSSELSQTSVGSITIDVCRVGCGGIWLDRGELERLDEESEPLPDIEKPTPGKKERNRFPRACPKCEDSRMVVQSYDAQNPVELDMCWSCGRIFLDYGELDAIRRGGGDREAAGNAIVRGVLNLKDLASKYSGQGTGGVTRVAAEAESKMSALDKVKRWLSRH